MIYINGGIVAVDNNDFSYNGMLTENILSNQVADLERVYTRSEFPWGSYSFTMSQ